METISEKKGRILVVDDDSTISLIVTKILKKEGYQVFTANNGRIGIEEALSIQPDLILMDIRMPEMDGYEATDLIKRIPQLTEVPVVFLTGVAPYADAGKAFRKGGVSYICKPFTNVQLLEVVNLAMMSTEHTNRD